MDHVRFDRLAAGLAVLAVHAALLGLLARLTHEPAASTARPLEVVFLLPTPRAIDLTPQPPPARAASTLARPRSTVTSGTQPGRVAPPPPVSATPPDSTPAASRPLSAVYLQQARQWDAQQAGPASSDPFADRTPPAAPDGRFRMRRPASAADVVASVGRLFGGAGYTTDDCARMRGSITGLMVAGDTRGAQEAIDYERRYCRP